MSKFRKFIEFFVKKQKTKQNVDEYYVFKIKQSKLELSVKKQLQIMQDFSEEEYTMHSSEKILPIIIYKELDVPVFYKGVALCYLKEMLPKHDIDETRVQLMFLEEKPGFATLSQNLIWVYDGYFVSVGIKSYAGYIAEIEQTTQRCQSDIGCLKLCSIIEENMVKSIILYFNVLTASPEKICLNVFDGYTCDLTSTLLKEYKVKPTEHRLIKDCNYFRRYFL